MSDIEMKKIAEELDRETDSAYTSRKLRKEIDKVSKKNKPKTTESELVTPEILNLDYRYVKLLGEGANGLTWLAKDRRTALNVAIKELKFVITRKITLITLFLNRNNICMYCLGSFLNDLLFFPLGHL